MLVHAACIEYRLNAPTISAAGLVAIRCLLAGEKVERPLSCLPSREWRELVAVLGRESE